MRFTHREQQVLRLVAQGLCNKSIGQQLGISPHTVRDHVCAMLLRTGCDNRVQLALRFGQQPPQSSHKPPPTSVGIFIQTFVGYDYFQLRN